MPTQKRDARRNYIDLLSDKGEENTLTQGQPTRTHPLRDYLRELVMGMLKTRDGAR
jgi:hypothetical protein